MVKIFIDFDATDQFVFYGRLVSLDCSPKYTIPTVDRVRFKPGNNAVLLAGMSI